MLANIFKAVVLISVRFKVSLRNKNAKATKFALQAICFVAAVEEQKEVEAVKKTAVLKPDASENRIYFQGDDFTINLIPLVIAKLFLVGIGECDM